MRNAIWLNCVFVLGACGATHDAATSETSQSVAANNGLLQNGLTTNGVYQNGVYQNGVYQNGVYQNGVYQNGVYQNGVYQNGVYQNGVYQNGVYQNGVYQNGVYQNGVYQNGVYQNGVYQNGVYPNDGAWISGLWSNATWQVGTNADALRTSRYTRQFLQYVYACAMPGTGDGYATVLDPWNGALHCGGTAGACAEGYTCSSNNTCVVPLIGAIGVGVNSDGTTWADTGRCDESCQRWVSACVLARTNAYGAHVQISMRAPDDAPAAVQAALAVTPDEVAVYSLREGAFYGNIFASTPVNGPPDPAPDYSGPTDGLVTATPHFFACAGPGSNIPEITKRFCSSQGDNQVISVTGICAPSDTTGSIIEAQCEDPDAGGAVHNCIGDQTYAEVITVYIHDPIEICGNSVCEKFETPLTCPTDCRVGGWAATTGAHIDAQYEHYGAAGNTVATADGGVVVATTDYETDTWTTPGADLVKYTSAGAYSWSHHVAWGGIVAGLGLGLGIGPTGTIAIATYNTGWDPFPGNAKMQLTTIAGSTGTQLGEWYLGSGNFTPQGSTFLDASDNVVIAGSFVDDMEIGGQTLASAPNDSDVFVVKLDAANTVWLTRVGDATEDNLGGSAIDPQGNIVVLVTGTTGAGIYKLDGATGAIVWHKAGAYTAVTTDATGNIFAAGVTPAGHDFPSTNTDTDLFVAKYAPDGTFLVLQTSGHSCHSPNCTGELHPYLMKVDGNNVVIAALGGGGGLDPILGPTTFPTYQFPPLFITAFATSDLHYAWTMEIPFILGGFTNGMDVDHAGHVFIAGTYGGSMIIDGVLLINDNPLLSDHTNTFVSSFNEPPATDTTPPLIGNAFDQTGAPLQTVPSDIIAQATSSDGATVFFMPPTAIDNGGAAITVSCSPAPNTTFPIGTTTVTCTASNSLGYAASAHFDVTVRDSLAPVMRNVPADITSSTTAVTFDLPTASDQVDGDRPVTCSPASGSTFPLGLSTVTCTASDNAGNTVEGSFHVTVASGPDTTPPVIAVPANMTREATAASGAATTFTATATDDVDGTDAVLCVPASGSTFSIGVHTVTCTAHDLAGNNAIATFTIVVQDTTPPVLTLPAHIDAAANPINAVVTYTATATDAVDGALSVTCSPASGSTFAPGTTTVACSATDANHNTSQGTFTVTVRDLTPPLITVPSLGAIEAVGPSGSSVAYAASATDATDGSVPVTCTPASNSTFAIGTTTVSCSAHDAAGNTATASFVVGVVDTTAPALVVPADITGEATGAAGLGVSFATSATDLVDGALPVTCSRASGSTFAIGTTPVTCTTSDTRGNTRSASFTVTVVDTTRPALTVPANITLAATDASGAVVTYAATATDSVDGAITPTCLPVSGSTFPVGTTTVTCSAVDAHSNAVTASFTITVTPLATDTTPPVITVPANITTGATSATGAPVTFAVSAVDAVDGNVAVTCSKASGSAFVLGTTTVTCSAHDAHDNTATQTFSVSVQVSWGGVLLPINTDGSAEFKLGSIVPVRFALTGASANITNVVATVTLTKTSSTITGTRHKLPRYLLPTTGTSAKWNPLTHHYYFRYDTTGLTQGTYSVKVDFHDGVSHTAQVSLGTFGCPACENDGGDD